MIRRVVFAVLLFLAAFSAAAQARVPPVAREGFAQPSVRFLTPVTMTIDIFNMNSSVMTNVGFTDSFPAFLTTASPANVVNTCGGTLNVAHSSIILSGGSVPANSTCTVSLDVQLARETPAPVTNILGTVTSAFGSSQELVTATISLAPEIPVLSTRALMVMAFGLVLVGVLAMRA